MSNVISPHVAQQAVSGGVVGPSGARGLPGPASGAAIAARTAAATIASGVALRTSASTQDIETAAGDLRAVPFVGVSVEPIAAGATGSFQTSGPLDVGVAFLGPGTACAVGTDTAGVPVRSTDPACVSAPNWIGTCDTYGNITVNLELGRSAATVDPRGEINTSSRATASSVLPIVDITSTGTAIATIEGMTFDADTTALSLIDANGRAFQSLTIRNCRFVTMSSCTALPVADAANVVIESCTFDGYGLAQANGVQFSGSCKSLVVRGCTFRAMQSGVILTPLTNADALNEVVIENNTFDFMWYSLPQLSQWTGEGVGVSYTQTSLTDTSKTFIVQPFGTTQALAQFCYVRAMPARSLGTITTANATAVIDTTATFTSDGIVVGELVRCGAAVGIIKSVDSDTRLNIEEWLDQATSMPTDTPSITTAYTVYGLLMARVDSGTGDTLSMNTLFSDLDGNPATPPDFTHYEVIPLAGYPITGSEQARKVRIVGNTFLRSLTDQCSPFGDDCEIAGNTFRDGQDFGITTGGSDGGGRHNLHDNRFYRCGSGAIYLGRGNSLVHHNQVLGWGARTAGFNNPDTGATAIVANPAAFPLVTAIISENIVDGGGLPQSYFGVSAEGGAIGVDILDNRISDTIESEIRISGAATAGIRVRHSTSSITYTAAGAGDAVGQTLYVEGTTLPLALPAAPGSQYTRTTNGTLFVKTGQTTDATGWEKVSTIPFDPSDISGLFLWHRADQINAGAVASWPDVSGNGDAGRDLAQGSVGSQPVASTGDAQFNGQAVVTFDGSNDFLSWGTWAATLSQPCTWFMVARQSTAGIQVLLDALTARQLILSNSGTIIEVNAGTGLPVPTTGDGFDTFLNQTTAILVVFDGAATGVYVRDTTSSITGDSGTNAPTTGNVGIFDDQVSFPFNGKIAEIAAWGRLLTDDEIAALFAYSVSRYGVVMHP